MATAIVAIHIKHESKMLAFWKIIKKSLLLTDFTSVTPLPDPDATPKALPDDDFLLKTSIKRWNQANLRYFKLYFDKAHEKGEIVLVGKDIYYRNIIFFI